MLQISDSPGYSTVLAALMGSHSVIRFLWEEAKKYSAMRRSGEAAEPFAISRS